MIYKYVLGQKSLDTVKKRNVWQKWTDFKYKYNDFYRENEMLGYTN